MAKKKEKRMVTCVKCDGTGTYGVSIQYGYAQTCTRCNGTGKHQQKWP